MEKYRTATYLGWDVVRYIPKDVDKVELYDDIIKFIKRKHHGIPDA